MRICLLNDSFPPVLDGVANVVTNYAERLHKRGLQVMVGTPRYPDADYSGYPYPVVAYQSFDTTALASGYRAGNPFSSKDLSELSAFAPDIIHCHCPAASATLALRVLGRDRRPGGGGRVRAQKGGFRRRGTFPRRGVELLSLPPGVNCQSWALLSCGAASFFARKGYTTPAIIDRRMCIWITASFSPGSGSA